jgi:hypothetical protein
MLEPTDVDDSFNISDLQQDVKEVPPVEKPDSPDPKNDANPGILGGLLAGVGLVAGAGFLGSMFLKQNDEPEDIKRAAIVIDGAKDGTQGASQGGESFVGSEQSSGNVGSGGNM